MYAQFSFSGEITTEVEITIEIGASDPDIEAMNGRELEAYLEEIQEQLDDLEDREPEDADSDDYEAWEEEREELEDLIEEIEEQLDDLIGE